MTHTDHITNHLITPNTNQIQQQYRQHTDDMTHTDHILQLHTNHLMTTYWPHTNNIVAHWPCTNHFFICNLFTVSPCVSLQSRSRIHNEWLFMSFKDNLLFAFWHVLLFWPRSRVKKITFLLLTPLMLSSVMIISFPRDCCCWHVRTFVVVAEFHTMNTMFHPILKPLDSCFFLKKISSPLRYFLQSLCLWKNVIPVSACSYRMTLLESYPWSLKCLLAIYRQKKGIAEIRKPE